MSGAFDVERWQTSSSLALSDGAGQTWTWSEWCPRVLGLAGRMKREWPRGDVTVAVALDAQRSADSALLATALLRADVPFALLHPRWTGEQRKQRLEELGRPPVIGCDDLPALESSTPHRLPPTVDDDRPAVTVFTSGSTGSPKAAVLSRRALAASARASEANLGWVDGDRWLLSMPLAHVGGLSIVTRCAAAGTGVVVDPSASFDPASMVELCEREAVTLLSVVPTMLHRLLDLPEWGLGGLRAILVGGAAAPVALVRRAVRRKLPVLLTYGLTESCSQVATQSVARLVDPDRCFDVGTPHRGTEICVADGPLRVRGATLFSGYLGPDGALYGGPEADGWWTTSDLGSVDGIGRLQILGRADDVIITGGENVHPFVVEEALRERSSVADACVFGLPDDEWGQKVAALVVLVEGARVDDLERSLEEDLASFQRPRLLRAVDALPTNAQGKVDREACRRVAVGQA